VKPEEIPENCGLMVVSKNGKQLRVMKRAQWREAEPFAIWEIASIVRSADRMQRFPETLLWKYAGQEIDNEGIDELVKQRRSYVDRDELEGRARAIAKDRLEEQNSDMLKYAEEMRKAGIEPPNFMLGKSNRYLYDSMVKDWVDTLAHGPSAKDIRQSIRQLKIAEDALKLAHDSTLKLISAKNKNQEIIPGS
jgi:tRNA G10  N-methylase Trm11